MVFDLPLPVLIAMSFLAYLVFRATAPLLAISERLCADSALALAGPPFLPPELPKIAAALLRGLDCNGFFAIVKYSLNGCYLRFLRLGLVGRFALPSRTEALASASLFALARRSRDRIASGLVL